MKEIWKDISNTNGIYQISNLGNVRSKYNKYSHEVGENYNQLKLYIGECCDKKRKSACGFLWKFKKEA